MKIFFLETTRVWSWEKECLICKCRLRRPRRTTWSFNKLMLMGFDCSVDHLAHDFIHSWNWRNTACLHQTCMVAEPGPAWVFQMLILAGKQGLTGLDQFHRATLTPLDMQLCWGQCWGGDFLSLKQMWVMQWAFDTITNLKWASTSCVSGLYTGYRYRCE